MISKVASLENVSKIYGKDTLLVKALDSINLDADTKGLLRDKVFNPSRQELVELLERGETKARDQYAQLMHQIIRSEGYAGDKPELFNLKNSEDVLKAIQDFFNPENSASPSSESSQRVYQKFLEESERIQKDFQEYHAHLLEALQQEGPYNISKIFGFINHYLLGIMPSNFDEDTVGGPIPFLGEQALREAGFPILPERENNEQRHLIFELLKNNGVLETEIQDPVAYNYNAAHHLKEILELDQSKILRLGAGRFPQALGDASKWIQCAEDTDEVNCGGFGDFQDDSITINVDSSQRPDVIASFLDLSFWASIPADTLETVYDNTGWGIGLENPDILSEIYRVLHPGGFLKVQDIGNTQEAENKLRHIGFKVLEGQNSEGNLFYLVAQKP